MKDILQDTLRYSRNRDYTGYDKADGMSSKILYHLPFKSKYINLAFQESAKRAPINIRPFLLVKQRQSFKGSALFALANHNTYRITDDEIYLNEAKYLADWLISNQCPDYESFCGVHKHAIQSLGGSATDPDDRNNPGIVSTSYGVKALLDVTEHNQKYAETARTATDFLFGALNYTESDGEAMVNYTPGPRGDGYTLNSNALGARMLMDLHSHEEDQETRVAARKILDYVVSNQEPAGGWMYRDPPSSSHLSMDNYHNGFIIESLLRYDDITEENRYEESVEQALSFYWDVLYEKNGAPCWDEDSTYPRDTHAAAQGIIVFTHAEEYDKARRIIEWTLENLYAGDGRFYYQKRWGYTKRFTLMRWCQAWMAYALSEYLVAVKKS